MNRIPRGRALVALGCVCALAMAGGAYAYFTSNGSGTGTASVGSASAVTLHATVNGNLFPGSSSPVSFTVDNPSQGSQRVGSISLASITVDAQHSTCSVVSSGGNADFSMPAVAVNRVFAPGNGQSVTQTGALTMNETGVNQDACQGATLTLHLVNS
jgi:hypothetical protein